MSSIICELISGVSFCSATLIKTLAKVAFTNHATKILLDKAAPSSIQLKQACDEGRAPLQNGMSDTEDTHVPLRLLGGPSKPSETAKEDNISMTNSADVKTMTLSKLPMQTQLTQLFCCQSWGSDLRWGRNVGPQGFA
jgi:hypothetical protein